MTDIVIIGQNEGAHILTMYASLLQYPFNRIWILDRCTDHSEQLLREIGETFFKTDENLQGRQTSHARNLGLSKTRPDSDVLFLDGDRYISSGDLSGLEKSENDIELLLLEDDFRNQIFNYYHYDMVYGTVHNYFFSCGIFLKRTAINKILHFQKELFCEDIQQYWGVEDTYLGDVCYHLRLLADIYNGCKLHGKFDNLEVDAHALQIRFDKREKLDVIWRPNDEFDITKCFQEGERY
jgi:hypothetical protein